MRRRVGWGLVLALVLASCSDGAGPDAAGSSIEVVEVEGTPIYRWAPQVDAWFQLVGSGDALVAVAEHLPSGIVRSTDRGRTWQAAKVPGRLGTRDGVALASNGDTVVVMGYRGGDSFFWGSVDRGATFTEIAADEDPVLAPSGHIVEAGGTLVLTGERGQSMQAGGPLVWRSEDRGRSWEVLEPEGVPEGAELSSLVEVPGDRLLAVMWSRDPVDHAIVVSSDGGRSWQPIELPIQLPQFGEPGLSPEGDAVVMSLELRRFITEDGGATWRELEQIEVDPNLGGYGLEFIGDVVVATGQNEPGDLEGNDAVAFRSADGGASWTPSDLSELECPGAGAETEMTGSLAVGDVFYTTWTCSEGDPEGRLVRSLDRGRSWQLVEGDGIDDLRILGFVPTSEDEALALGARGKQRSLIWLTGEP